MKQVVVLPVILGVTLASLSWAGALELSPTQAVVVAGNGSEPTLIGLKFDFSRMRRGEGRHVDLARLEWPVGATGSRELREFESFVAAANWTAQGVAAGQTSLEKGDRALDGLVAPGATSAAPAILVMDVSKLVEAWASGEVANNGIILSTQDVSAATLESVLSTAKLKVWYGFHRSPSSGQ